MMIVTCVMSYIFPLPQALDKDGLTVILLDTEGIDAALADKKNDVTMLVLTLLLSSLFIFNTLSVPKQGQLEDLE